MTEYLRMPASKISQTASNLVFGTVAPIATALGELSVSTLTGLDVCQAETHQSKEDES